jgi:hypothetical protein
LRTPLSSGDASGRAGRRQRTWVARVKQLVARTPTQLKLGQFNPEKEFAVALAKVKAVHRVLTLGELLGT